MVSSFSTKTNQFNLESNIMVRGTRLRGTPNSKLVIRLLLKPNLYAHLNKTKKATTKKNKANQEYPQLYRSYFDARNHTGSNSTRDHCK